MTHEHVSLVEVIKKEESEEVLCHRGSVLLSACDLMSNARLILSSVSF